MPGLGRARELGEVPEMKDVGKRDGALVLPPLVPALWRCPRLGEHESCREKESDAERDECGWRRGEEVAPENEDAREEHHADGRDDHARGGET